MEARTRPQPPKPLEGNKGNLASTSENWRAKKRVTISEPEEDDEESAPEMDRRPRAAEIEKLRQDRVPRIEKPYKSDKPDIGPRSRPIIERDNRPPEKRSPDDKAYRVRAPIQREGITEDVIEQIHNTEVLVKLGDLFGLSRELREGERLQLTKVRQPVAPRAPAKLPELVTVQAQEDLLPTEQVLDLPLGYDALDIEELPSVGVFVSSIATGDVPAGSLVAQDPYLQYLESLPDGERPKQVYVARESASLQAIYPTINESGSMECILDSGSQIVSMSLEAAKILGLVWDPSIKIFMESANKSMEESVGLARNVQFKWGTMTVYLQVHIIRNPAYKVLLGRPFDLLTRSRIENSADGSQIITITDPNTGKKCAMPTYDRQAKKHRDDATVRPAEPEANKASNFTHKGFQRSSRN